MFDASMPSSRDYEEIMCQLEYSKAYIALDTFMLTTGRNFNWLACIPFHSKYDLRFSASGTAVKSFACKKLFPVKVCLEDDLVRIGVMKLKESTYRLL